MPQMKRWPDTPQSVTGRALSILGAFGPDHTVLTLSEISDRTGLPVTTTLRLLGDFVEWGALVRDGSAATGSDPGWWHSRPLET